MINRTNAGLVVYTLSFPTLLMIEPANDTGYDVWIMGGAICGCMSLFKISSWMYRQVMLDLKQRMGGMISLIIHWIFFILAMSVPSLMIDQWSFIVVVGLIWMKETDVQTIIEETMADKFQLVMDAMGDDSDEIE